MSNRTPSKAFLCTLVLVGLFAAALLSGCGSSSSDGSESSGGEAAGSESTATQETGKSESNENNENNESNESGESGAAGGNGSENATNAGKGGTATSTQFTKEADRVCAKAQAATSGQLARYIGKKGSEATEGLVENVVVPELEGEIESIQALGGPPEASEAIVAILEELIEEAEADPENFVYKGEAVIKATKESKAQGFKRCGAV
jgi:hypothetical protein